MFSDLPRLWLPQTRTSSSGQSCSSARSALKMSPGSLEAKKKKGKVETNLTSEGDLLADEGKEQKAPVKDDREQKSYGKENCSCGKTKTTRRRVSLLRSGIRFVCLFSVGRAFSLVLQSRTWKLIRFVVTTDSLAIESGKGLSQAQMMDEGGEGEKKNRAT